MYPENQKLNVFPLKSFNNFILAFVLVMQFAMPGVVLCFGSDGHVDLESYSNGICVETVSETASHDPSGISLRHRISSNNPHCGPCIDIRISDNNSEHKLPSYSDLTQKFDVNSFVSFDLTSLWLRESSNQRLLAGDIPIGNVLTESLQTTILIC